MARSSSPVDMKKVLEGRSTINQEDLKDAPLEHRMYMLMLENDYSADELVYILCPDEIDYNRKRKKDIPNKHGINFVKKAVCQLNKWIINRNEVVNCIRNKNGQWRYSSIQKMQDFDYTKKHGDVIKKNITILQNHKKTIIKTPKKIKDAAKKETQRIIRLSAIERKRRKKDGDDYIA